MAPWYVGKIVVDRIEVIASAVGWTPYIPALPPGTEAGDLAIGWLMESQGVVLNGWNDVIVGETALYPEGQWIYRGHVLHKIVTGPNDTIPATNANVPQPVGAWVIVKGGKIAEIKAADNNFGTPSMTATAPELDGLYPTNLRFLGHINTIGRGAGLMSPGEEIVRVPLGVGPEYDGGDADIFFSGSKDNIKGAVTRQHYAQSSWVGASIGIARK